MKAISNFYENRGTSPRLYRNMICFLAPDAEFMAQLKQDVRIFLAWKSIDSDRESLNLDAAQRKEVFEAIQNISLNIRDRIQNTYCYSIVPSQEGTENIVWKESKNTGNSNPVQKSFQRLKQDEYLVDTLSPKILTMEMEQFNLWKGKDTLSIRELWEDYTRYVYLHRLKNQQVLYSALRSGISSSDFFGFSEDNGEAGTYRGLILGDNGFLNISPDGYLVKLDVAKIQMEKQKVDISKNGGGTKGDNAEPEIGPQSPVQPTEPSKKKPTHFYGTVMVEHNKLGSTAGTINQEILQHMAQLPGVKITVTMDIEIDIPDGIDDDVARTVKENCKTLKFTESNFE
jgi:hypothetical protein